MVSPSLHDLVREVILRFSGGIENGWTEADIYCGRIGKNLVLELVREAHSATVKKYMGDLVSENRCDGLRIAAILGLQLDKELVRLRKLDATRRKQRTAVGNDNGSNRKTVMACDAPGQMLGADDRVAANVVRGRAKNEVSRETLHVCRTESTVKLVDRLGDDVKMIKTSRRSHTGR